MNQTKIINGEEHFQIMVENWSAGPSKEGYTLMYSADNINFTEWPDKVPAGENLVVNLAAQGMWYYLKGNKTRIKLTF